MPAEDPPFSAESTGQCGCVGGRLRLNLRRAVQGAALPVGRSSTRRQPLLSRRVFGSRGLNWWDTGGHGFGLDSTPSIEQDTQDNVVNAFHLVARILALSEIVVDRACRLFLPPRVI